VGAAIFGGESPKISWLMLLKHPDLVHKMSFQILEVEKSQDPNVLGVALHIEIHVIESLV
jgi:hypothetical protein